MVEVTVTMIQPNGVTTVNVFIKIFHVKSNTVQVVLAGNCIKVHCKAARFHKCAPWLYKNGRFEKRGLIGEERYSATLSITTPVIVLPFGPSHKICFILGKVLEGVPGVGSIQYSRKDQG